MKSPDKGPGMPLWMRIFFIVYAISLVSLFACAMQMLYLSGTRLKQREFETALSQQHMMALAIEQYAGMMSEDLARSTMFPMSIARAVERYAAYYTLKDSSIALYDGKGDLIFSNMDEDARSASVAPSRTGTQVYGMRSLGNRKVIFVSSWVDIREKAYRFDFARDITDVVAGELQMARQTGLFVVIALGVVGALLFFSIRRALSPLRALRAQAQAVTEGRYDRRIEIVRRDEIGSLTETFNGMAVAVEEREAKLVEATQARDRFVANLAHELKTPITSIVGFAEMCLSGRISKEQNARALLLIKREGTRLDALSARLLDFYRITEGAGVHREVCRIEGIIGHVAGLARPIMEERGQKLHTQCRAECAMLDSTLIISLLLNLIENASKHSPADGIIDLRAVSEDGAVRFCVTDRGSGIDPEALPHVKEPFFMEDRVRSRAHNSAGLGLTLCDAIAKGHGGELTIESGGGGTTVSVWLPIHGGEKNFEMDTVS